MECFTEEHRALVEQNLLIMEPAAGGSPEYLKELLEDNIARFRPDVVGLNPLMAFCGHDYTRELGAMLYQVVDPVMKKHRVAFVGVHHVIKPIYRKDTSSYGAYDYQYLAAGDARIANFPRASLQIDPVSTNPVVTACFRITKRWQRVAWLNEHGEPTHERYLKHSTDRIAWIDATEEEVNEARAAEQPREILEILPPPSEEGIIREEIRLRGKNEFGWGKNKTDDYLKIVLHDGLAERYEGTTEANRKEALFRRKYE
jgi:hypothetical protein